MRTGCCRAGPWLCKRRKYGHRRLGDPDSLDSFRCVGGEGWVDFGSVFVGGPDFWIAGSELGLSETDSVDGAVGSFAVVESGAVVYRDCTGGDDCGRPCGEDYPLVGEVGWAGMGGSTGGCCLRSDKRMRTGN